MSAGRPVVVVVGQPDHILLTSLRTVGLTPIAEDDNVVVWGPPPSPHRDKASEPGERNPTVTPAGLLMTIADAALALGLGRSTVYELIGRGELEVVHVGRSARVPAAALHTLVERLRGDEVAGHPGRNVA